ncbi:MAG: hypothetical protein WD468_10495 [Pirellulales bacterium]
MIFRRLTNGQANGHRHAMSADMISLLDDRCNARAIKHLLDQAKDAFPDKEVKVSAPKKEVLIRENLRNAVAAGAVELADVERLLLESEENGQQVVLFYEPANEDLMAILNSPEQVAATLFGGENWKEQHPFPLFREKPQGDVWSDFRLEDDSGWVAKLYRGDDRWVLDRDQSEETDTRRVKVWVKRYSRDVFLFRWHEQGILEVRTPRVDGKRELLEVVDIAWGALSPIAALNDFTPFKLTKAASKLAHDEKGLDGEIALGPARVSDSSGGSATFAPRSSDQYLLESKEHREAIKIFKLCRELSVYWLRPSEDDEEQDRVKTVIGYQSHENCVLIPARVGRSNATYVTNRLLKIEAEERQRNGSGRAAEAVG